jgi:hypothetical protein
VALKQVDAAGEFNLQLIDISDLSGAEREARAQQIREDEARTLFDLEKGPLLWVTLVRLDEEDHQLLETMHHDPLRSEVYPQRRRHGLYNFRVDCTGLPLQPSGSIFSNGATRCLS